VQPSSEMTAGLVVLKQHRPPAAMEQQFAWRRPLCLRSATGACTDQINTHWLGRVKEAGLGNGAESNGCAGQCTHVPCRSFLGSAYSSHQSTAVCKLRKKVDGGLVLPTAPQPGAKAGADDPNARECSGGPWRSNDARCPHALLSSMRSTLAEPWERARPLRGAAVWCISLSKWP
jgi:hypothetical protein